MVSYAPLSQHLSALRGDSWTASFQALEAILGTPLPKAARTPRWWSAWGWRTSPQAKAWRSVGWRVGDADLQAGQVTFERGNKGATRFRPDRSITPAAMRRAAEDFDPPTGNGFSRGALLVAVLVAGALGYLIGREVGHGEA